MGPFTEPTTEYWQTVEEQAGGIAGLPEARSDIGSFRYRYPARLPDGRLLWLPLRTLPDGRHAVASLIATEASFNVIDILAGHMAALAAAMEPEFIVGLPTLGLVFAPLVARSIGHRRYVPLSYSRKFWFDEALSQPVSSITSPTPGKRLYLDPNLLDLVAGRRIVVVDDAISTGSTATAALRLLASLGATPAGMVVALKQSNRWIAPIAEADAALVDRVRGVFGSPLFHIAEDGWRVLPGSEPQLP